MSPLNAQVCCSMYVRMPVCQASSSVWALAQPQPTVPHNCLASFSPVNIAERSFVGVGDGRAAQPLGTAWLYGVGRPSSGVPTVFPICHMYVSNQAGREPQLCNKSWARVAKVQIAAWNPAWTLPCRLTWQGLDLAAPARVRQAKRFIDQRRQLTLNLL